MIASKRIGTKWKSFVSKQTKRDWLNFFFFPIICWICEIERFSVWRSNNIAFISDKLIRERNKKITHTRQEKYEKNWGLKNDLVCEQWRLDVINIFVANSAVLSWCIDFVAPNSEPFLLGCFSNWLVFVCIINLSASKVFCRCVCILWIDERNYGKYTKCQSTEVQHIGSGLCCGKLISFLYWFIIHWEKQQKKNKHCWTMTFQFRFDPTIYAFEKFVKTNYNIERHMVVLEFKWI